MSDFKIISEGMLPTSRLSVYHIVSEPTNSFSLGRILLLGGSNFDLRLKRGFLNTLLPEQYNLCAYEPRGIGKTEQPAGNWTMLDYAKDALSVLDALGWQDAIVIGESFGAMTALHLAKLAPERITEMVLASGSAGGAGGNSHDISEFLALPRVEAAKKALHLQDSRNINLEIEDPLVFSKKLEARIAFETAFEDPSISSGGYAKLLAARAKHDAWDDLSTIDIPALVICGEFDSQALPSVQKAMSDALKNSIMRTFSAGHGLLFLEPAVLDYVSNVWLEHKAPLERIYK